MYLALVFYGSLAGAALWATLHDSNLRTVGAMLIASYVISNATYFGGTLEDRAGIYTMLEILVTVSAYMAHTFCQTQSVCWALRTIVVVSIISICMNVAFATIVAPSHHQTYLYSIVTNVCFGAECVLTIATGVIDGLGAGRFGNRPRALRAHPRSHVLPTKRREP